MIGSLVMLLILFALNSPDWILLVLFALAVVGLRHVGELTRRARKLDQ